MQLYSLRRVGDGGFGDTQALEDLARVAGERGAEALAISPLHAMFSSDTQRYSPYSPSSRLFLNSLYAAPGAVLGERAMRAAIDATGLTTELQQLEQQPLINWPVAAQAKHRVLLALYEGFVHGEHPLHEDFSSFRHASGEALENHCRFEALQVHRAALGESLDWREWPEQWRDPRSAALAEFAEEERGTHRLLRLLPVADYPVPGARTNRRPERRHEHWPDRRPGGGGRRRRQSGLEPAETSCSPR